MELLLVQLLGLSVAVGASKLIDLVKLGRAAMLHDHTISPGIVLRRVVCSFHRLVALSILAHSPSLSFLLLSRSMEHSVLRLIEVGIPALSEFLHVLIRVRVWDLLLWRVVIEDLLRLFLSSNHAFDFV